MRNSVKIKAGIQALSHKSNEITSGKVVAGSVDEGSGVLKVLPTESTVPISNVTIGSIKSGDCSIVLVPEDDTEVVIGCVDGPGNWTLLKADRLQKVCIKTGETTCVMDSSGLALNNGETTIEVSSLVKMSTSGESMHALLKDLMAAIKAITVGTPSGTSTVPVNATTFDILTTRLDNLLQA